MSEDNVVCLRSNISGAGRRRRVRFAWMAVAASVVVLVVSHFVWPAPALALGSFVVRMLAVYPFVATAIAVYLEVSRKTCVLMASKGRRELDQPGASGRMTEAVPEAVPETEAEASRRVARSIYRDTTIGGAIVAGAASLLLHSL